MELCEILIKGLVAFFVAAGAARIGIHYYYKQKEYELVKNRYLENSLDVILSELENGLGLTNHNYARVLNVIKAYRDQGDNFDIAELDKGFLDFNSTEFKLVAHHRLQLLTGSQIFWSTYQLALAYITNANSLLTKEIVDTIRLKITTDKINVEAEEMIEKMFLAAKQEHEDGYRFSELVHQIQLVSDVLEREPMTFKQVEKFRNKKTVKSVISMLEREYKEETAELEKTA